MPRRPLLALILVTTVAVQAQERPDPGAARVGERIAALQREASQLARQSRTLVNELRGLEIQRDLRVEEARQAEAAVAAARQELQQTTDRLAALELRRLSQLPDVKAQLVDIYKRGRTGYAQLLAGAENLRNFARATRAVGALASISTRRIEDHRKTMDAVRRERAALQEKAGELQQREAQARGARTAAEGAVSAHRALIARIDSERDLTAQYVGELQVVHDRMQQMTSAHPGPPGAAVAVPLAPFRGALEWPVTAPISGRFGQAAGRLGGTAVRNGIEFAAPEGSPVRAVHGGTVGFADVFTGFGRLVIVDHGANSYSLYGYLGSTGVERGAVVSPGTELGRVGTSPAGPAALYFEMRVDGRSVDPVQWLRPR